MPDSNEENKYVVNDYFLDKLSKLTQEEIATYKRLHKLDVSKERVLLRAAFDLLKSCNEGIYVKNVLAEPVTYSGLVGDGFSLLNDIADLLKIEGIR